MLQQVPRHKCSISNLSVNKDHVEYVRITPTHKENLLVSDSVLGSQSDPGLPRTPKTAKFQVDVGQFSSLPGFSEGTCGFTLKLQKTPWLLS